MPRCEGVPDGPCPQNAVGRNVKLSQGDLMLCPSCDAVRFPTTKQAGHNKKSAPTLSSVNGPSPGTSAASTLTTSVTSASSSSTTTSSLSTPVTNSPTTVSPTDYTGTKLVVNELLTYAVFYREKGSRSPSHLLMSSCELILPVIMETGHPTDDWGEAFRLFDVDDAGFIDARKLFNVIRLLGYNPTEAEVQDLIAAGDKDGNGEIDYEEFQSIVSNNLLTTDDDVTETFCVFDRDESGYIGIDEISLMFSRFGHDLRYEYIQAVTETADVDGDGIISFKDFVEVFNQRPDSTYVIPPEPETKAHSDDNDEEEEEEEEEEDETGGSRSHISDDHDSSI